MDKEYEHPVVESAPETAPTVERDLVTRILDAIPSLPRTVRYGLAISLSILWVLPFIGLFMASVRPLSEILDGWWTFDEFTVTFQNYEAALTWSTAPMSDALINTAIVTFPAVLVVTLLAAMTAYPFARFSFPYKKTIFFVFILVMAAPPELVAMGNYNLLQGANLFDTYVGLILIHIGWGMGWCVLFLRNFMLGIPEELEEAARVDGASRYQIFKTIILPLSAPALVSVGVIQFTWVWNAFFFPLVFMRSPELYLAPQVLPLMVGRVQVDWGLVAAASILTMAVPVILFVFLQRYYKRGMIVAVAD